MPHVGRERLNPDIQGRIERQLFAITASASGQKLLGELLTETERLMLAKRLAALLMLLDEQSYYRIEQALGMSTSTIKRLHAVLLAGEFPWLEDRARNKRAKAEFESLVGLLLRAGLPPRGYRVKKRK